MRRGGLGRGLSSLLPGAPSGAGLLELPIDVIDANPRQPRTDFDDDALDSLANSIREVGLLQPVVVRRRDQGYELVAGERRLRAARRAGLATIPAIVREGEPDSLREALVENIHREDLSPLELAAALQELQQELGGQDAVAERLGFSRAHVANTIRLLALPADVQRLLAEGRIQAGHARALLGLPDDEARSVVALRVAAEGLSVREVEELVKHYAGPPARRRPAPAPDPATAEVEEQLADSLGTRVRVTMGRRRGRVVIDVGSREDLERIVARIVGRP